LKEFLITSQTQKETPQMTANEIKKGQYQWMFVKQNPKARELTTIDMYRRLLMQHAKHRETVKFVLKQLLRHHNFIEQRCARFEQAFQSFGQRETAFKQEIHKYKEMVCSRDKKIEELQRQLAERDDLVAKYRKIVSPSAQRAPRSPMEPSGLGGKYPGVGNENLPPMSSHRMAGRPSPVGRVYDGFAQPESSRGQGFELPSRPQSLAQQCYPYPPSQPYVDGRQRLATPIPRTNGGTGSYNNGQGHADNDHLRRSRISGHGPYNHSLEEYSRTVATSNREASPMSHRYDRQHGFFGDGRGDGSVAGSHSTNSGGRILQINKDTPYSFTGGVQKMRHHDSYKSGGGYDRR
jgi:uncharacterized protein (UPF0305 family)